MLGIRVGECFETVALVDRERDSARGFHPSSGEEGLRGFERLVVYDHEVAVGLEVDLVDVHLL